ncbi:F-box/kelch-repeat protein At3g23880-like [Silene latifolia]|uniref:F-box/kelch-repeat protein At3g23880-like n=1 Tax=Silene latifolia TaxID=37657 RepID=UPI003D76B7C1
MENKQPNNSNEKQVISQQSDLTDVLIFEEILTRLPVKSILRFKSVSKQWYSTLSSSNFANTHLKKSPFSHPSAPVNNLIIQSGSNCYIFSYDDEVDQISHNFEDNVVKLNTEFLVENDDERLFLAESCNGLICITTAGSGKYFILWNPATRKLNTCALPNEYLNCFEKGAKYFRTTLGFGYVSSIDDYKFVAILTVRHGNSESLFALIFSLRENRWRKIDLDNTLCFGCDTGVLVSEKLYWRAYSDEAQKLVSFDLAAEMFDVIEVDWDRYETLGVLKGCLHKLNWSDTFKVDILEPPAIVKSIELPKELMLERFSKIIGFTKTDKLFVTEWLSNNFGGRFFNVRTLAIVDTCTGTGPMQYTHLLNFGNVPFKIARYVPSLVSPFSTEDS